MGISMCSIPTISEEDVVNTLSSFESGKCGAYNEEEIEAAYYFASELTGKSVDTLGMWVQQQSEEFEKGNAVSVNADNGTDDGNGTTAD